MRRVLVTGATGFVGRHTLEPLRARGFIASGTTRPVRDVIGAVADRLQAQDLFQLGTVARAASDPSMLRADTRRLRDDVGWHDRLTFDQALDATIAGWRARHSS